MRDLQKLFNREPMRHQLQNSISDNEFREGQKEIAQRKKRISVSQIICYQSSTILTYST